MKRNILLALFIALVSAVALPAQQSLRSAYFMEGVEAYGLKSYDIPVHKEAFIQALRENPIVVRVGPGSFINAGHYMVVDSYKNNSFVINDPYNMRKNTLENIPWWRLRGEVTVAWEIK